MTLGIATLLLLLGFISMIVISVCLRKKRKICIVCNVILALIILALASYIGLIFLFVDAARNKPPI